MARRSSRLGTKTAATFLAMGLVMAACGDGNGGDGDAAEPATAGDDEPEGDAATGEGVAVGASMEEYQEAFADIDPIEISWQISTGPDAPVSRGLATEYAAAVEEWSDGKITFDVIYASGVVPFDQANDGVQQGLVDQIHHAPIYEPDRFPAINLGIGLTMLADPTPVVGLLQTYAMFNEFAFEQPDMVEEFAANGMVPITPFLEQGGARLLCVDDDVQSLDDLAGKEIRVSSAAHADEIAALGATPVSLPMGEIFEAFQRGIVDCAAVNLTTADAMGLAEVSGSWTIDSEVSFSGAPSTLSFNEGVWESYPLEVQQLLWDRLDVKVEWTMWGFLENNRAALEGGIEEHGLSINEFDEDAREAFEEHFDAWVEETSERAPAGIDGDEFAQQALDLRDKWLGIVEDLGYRDEDTTWSEFSSLDVDGIDLAPYAERVWEEIYLPRRPG